MKFKRLTYPSWNIVISILLIISVLPWCNMLLANANRMSRLQFVSGVISVALTVWLAICLLILEKLELRRKRHEKRADESPALEHKEAHTEDAFNSHMTAVKIVFAIFLLGILITCFMSVTPFL